MAEQDFDANELIAGFPLLRIKRALSSFVLIRPRDDVKVLAQTLRCPPRQALRVLDELERRGLVTKMTKPKRWEPTPKGNQLAYHWHPPRRFLPAIERDPESSMPNQGLESVPCSILRFTPDEEDVFEEALAEVGVNADYEGERLVEITVMQPDDYDDHCAGLCDMIFYLAPADATRFAAGLQTAIEKAEAEVARTRAITARRAKRSAKKQAPSV